MAAETGNSYISETIKDTIDFPTTNLEFLTTESSKKVSRSDGNSSRQPKIAIWPPKPEMLISLELWQIASKFQRQIGHFWPWRTRQKSCQEIATKTNNRKRRCGCQNGHIYIPATMTYATEIPNPNLGFPTTLSSKKLFRAIAITIDNRKWQNIRFGRFRLTSSSQSLGYIFIEFVMVENAGLAVGISTLSVTVLEI